MPSMSKSSKTEAHNSGMQDQPHPRPVHLAAQPGVKVSCRCAGKSRKFTSVNALPPSSSRWQTTPFVREGEGQANLTTIRPDTGQLGRARDWKLLADLGKKLCFPAEIAATNLRPDIVLWSASLKLVYIIELTCPGRVQWRRPTNGRS